MENSCSYQKCLTCSSQMCWTGKVARSQGEKGYDAHIKMLDEAERILENEEIQERVQTDY